MSAGVDAVAQKEPVLKEWQEIKNLVEAEAAEAKAQEKSEAEQVDVGSSGSAGPQQWQPDLNRHSIMI